MADHEPLRPRAGVAVPPGGNREIKPSPEQGVMTDRFICCHDPEQADQDAAVRAPSCSPSCARQSTARTP